ATRQSRLWRDGFIPRFAFVTPDDTDIQDAPFPSGDRSIPASLIVPLMDWNTRLGEASCTITPRLDAKGKPRPGEFAVERHLVPETVYTPAPDVGEAYYHYDSALRELTAQRQEEFLDGNYARFPVKALRIAVLLAALQDTTQAQQVEIRHWAR